MIFDVFGLFVGAAGALGLFGAGCFLPLAAAVFAVARPSGWAMTAIVVSGLTCSYPPSGVLGGAMVVLGVASIVHMSTGRELARRDAANSAAYGKDWKPKP